MYMKTLFKKTLQVLITSYSLVSCQTEPVSIACGEDECDNCKMTISDPKYGAELISDKGKVFKFDSIECLADYSNKVESGTIGSLWVTDFSNPENFINAKEAFYLKSKKLRSPMGLNLSAFKNSVDLEKVINEFSGHKISWDELLKFVSEEWN
jgi:copper chaperone NosL